MRELELVQGTTQALTLDLEQEGVISQVIFRVFKLTGQKKEILKEYAWPSAPPKEDAVKDNDNYTFVLTPDVTKQMVGSYGVEVEYISDGHTYKMQAGEIVILKESRNVES